MSRWSDVVYFNTTKIITDDLLQEIEVPGDPREVFANKRSITQTEFFNAGQKDLKAAKLFEVRLADYNQEEYLHHEGVKYFIYRTFEKGENIELYGEVRVGGN